MEIYNFFTYCLKKNLNCERGQIQHCLRVFEIYVYIFLNSFEVYPHQQNFRKILDLIEYLTKLWKTELFRRYILIFKF